MTTRVLLAKAPRGAIIAILLIASVAGPAATQALLDPTTQPQFVNAVPIPAVVNATHGGKFTAFVRETQQWLGLQAPGGAPLMTTVWGFQVSPGKLVKMDMEGAGDLPKVPTYPGPTFVAQRDVPVEVMWKNELPPYNNAFPGPGGHLLPVDPTVHMAHPVNGGIPIVIHLHGGHSESASDGLPDEWFTQDWAELGSLFAKKRFHYDNDQEAATLWYHDHALGITRLNVYAGMAGFYLLRDNNENQLIYGGVLPSGPYEAGLAIQDRMFTDTGQLFWPSSDPDIEPGFDPLPPGPSIIAEFFGDFIVVNGMAWPKFEVEPRKYRMRLLNGSDSRFYVFELRDDQFGGSAQPFFQIGTDSGLLPTPVALTRLLLAPGERADLIVDFAGQTELYLRNFGPDEPFKGLNPDGTNSDGEGGTLSPADPATTGQIMKFVVNKPLNPNIPDATVGAGTILRPAIVPPVQNGATRNLVLFEGRDKYGRLQPLLGTLDDGSLSWFQPVTENPMVNDIEVWEVYNSTEDAHPIHLHLVAFQIINRESFTGTLVEKDQPQHDGGFGVGKILTDVVLGGDAAGPAPNEAGFKDTAVMPPGTVTRLIAKFDREGFYVWHCHILSHEDHEMMRPYHVGPMPMTAVAASAGGGGSLEAASSGDTGSKDVLDSPGATLEQNSPNPFNPVTSIGFELREPGSADLKVYDVRGKEVRALAERAFPAGAHTVEWDGRDNSGNAVSSGVYFYQLRAGNLILKKKMIMLK
jgi:spore coat protein A